MATRQDASVLLNRPGRRRGAFFVGGLGFGAVLAYVLYVFFDPVNLFALRLQEATVGTTNITTLSVGLALAFVSGVTMIFTPCGMPLVFTLNSMAREGREHERSWLPPLLLFTAGITLVMAVWGAVVGAAGRGIVSFLADPSRRFALTEVLYALLGLLALLMALWEFGWVRLPRLAVPRGIPRRIAGLRPFPRSFAMGAALGGGFGVGCPFPTYQAVLAWASRAIPCTVLPCSPPTPSGGPRRSWPQEPSRTAAQTSARSHGGSCRTPPGPS